MSDFTARPDHLTEQLHQFVSTPVAGRGQHYRDFAFPKSLPQLSPPRHPMGPCRRNEPQPRCSETTAPKRQPGGHRDPEDPTLGDQPVSRGTRMRVGSGSSLQAREQAGGGQTRTQSRNTFIGLMVHELPHCLAERSTTIWAGRQSRSLERMFSAVRSEQ